MPLSDLRVANRDDDVTGSETGPVRWPLRYHGVDQCSAVEAPTEMRRQLGSDLLEGNPEPRALHGAVFDQLPSDTLGDLGRNGETDSRSAADDHRVDPEHSAVKVHERAAGVPRVDAGVGLQIVLDFVCADAAATLRTENARSHGVVQTKWRSDRDDELPDSRFVRRGELCFR